MNAIGRAAMLLIVAVMALPQLSSPADARKKRIKVDERDVWLLVPRRRPPKRGFPLVVALHWSGGRASWYIKAWKSHYHRGRFIVALPNANSRGRWRMIDKPHVFNVVREIRKRYRIDRRRVYLAGFSRGGTFSYYYGLTEESPFQGIAPIAAGLVLPLPYKQKSRMPICLVHGRLDSGIPASRTRRMVPILRRLGHRVRFRLLSGVRHDHPTKATDWIWRCLDRKYRRVARLERRKRRRKLRQQRLSLRKARRKRRR